MPNKSILAVFVSDWHVGSLLGLCPSIFHRELGSTHRPGKAVRTLWRSWLQFWNIIAAKKQELNAVVYAFAVGDLGDVNKYSSTQLISTNKKDVLAAMIDAALPMAEVADHVFIIRGTESHTGGNGELEELLARDLTNSVHCEEADSASWWVVKARLGGVLFEVTHHPPTSSYRPWTLDQAVSRAASIVAARYFDSDAVKEMPDVCVWAHAHTRGAQGKGMGGVWGFFLPPWQLRTSFSYRLGAGVNPQRFGGLWLAAQNGKVIDWDWERWATRKARIWIAP